MAQFESNNLTKTKRTLSFPAVIHSKRTKRQLVQSCAIYLNPYVHDPFQKEPIYKNLATTILNFPIVQKPPVGTGTPVPVGPAPNPEEW